MIEEENYNNQSEEAVESNKSDNLSRSKTAICEGNISKTNHTPSSSSSNIENYTSTRANNQKQLTENEENDSFLEQSYEVISPIAMSKQQQTSHSNSIERNANNNNGGNSNNNTNNKQVTSKQQDDIVNDSKPRSNSESPANSFQDRIRKSNSFLSRLQSSSEENEQGNSTNIQGSLASAFSSFSSFTSNFSLNPSNNNGNTSNNSSTNDSLSISTSTTTTATTRLERIQETKEDIFIKKASLERKNLISLTKLIVKDLISTSLLSSRTIDDCQNAIHLNNYFTLIDRVLKHGLKQNLLSNRSTSLWNALDSLPKYLKESTLMSESVRSLANTKTPDGKIKAWLRLVMMQKKMPEYFNELLANKNVLLKEIYHDYAFMMNDEAQVFAGLIIGVNVIDCNFFVKEANFDLMDDIIDLSPYLKAANIYDSEQPEESELLKIGQPDLEKLTAVLDQKNYLEEWNKRLEATIADLKSKIKCLEEQNSKLEMEAKVNEVRINKLLGNLDTTSNLEKNAPSTSIAEAIKNFIGNSADLAALNANKLEIETGGPTASYSANNNHKQQAVEDQFVQGENSNQSAAIDQDSKQISSTKSELNQEDEESGQSMTSSKIESKVEVVVVKDTELQKQLVEQEKEFSNLKERAGILEASYRGALEKIKVLERDLDVQTSMNADKETTIKIYEKDIREKQAQVESLRVSLNDSKRLNAELNERLTETSNKLKDRVKSVSTLQASLDKWKLENKTLATRLQDKQTAFKSVSQELEKAIKTMEDLKKYNEKVNEELKKERESGQSSSVTVETQNARISELTEKLAAMENELNDVIPYRDQTEELTTRCRDYELSLEEIGAQLRESRLEVENLKENSAVYLDSQWMDSKQVKNCALCQQLFSVTRRKHHCRLCGNVFCQTCSDNKMELASSSKPVRVCDTCHSFLLAKFVKSSTTA